MGSSADDRSDASRPIVGVGTLRFRARSSNVENVRGVRPLATPGDVLLHPLAAGAVMLLVVNDHILKLAFPGFVTGKVSDFAGLLFFPLLLAAAWEVGSAILHRWTGPTWFPPVLATSATGLAFVLVKTTTGGSSLFSTMLGSTQWLGALAASAFVAGPTPVLRPVVPVRDPTDLIALISLVAALLIGLRRVRFHSRSETVAS
jgi:hypothetical protein